MEYLFLLLFAVFGATFTFVHAEIMNILGIRQFLNRWEFTRKLQKCALCSGTYISLFFGLFYIPLNFLIPFIFCGAGFTFMMERIVILLDEHIIKLEKERD